MWSEVYVYSIIKMIKTLMAACVAHVGSAIILNSEPCELMLSQEDEVEVTNLAQVPQNCTTKACYKRLKGALKILQAKQRVAEQSAKTASVQQRASVKHTVNTFKAAALAMKKITDKARVRVEEMEKKKKAAVDKADADKKVAELSAAIAKKKAKES